MATALHTASLGLGLNVAERVATENSLTKLSVVLADPNSAEAPSVSWWGKILGTEKDYLIVQAVSLGESIQKKFFFSADGGINFAQLPAVDLWISEKAATFNSRFIGNPAYQYPNPKKPGQEDDDDQQADDAPVDDDPDADDSPKEEKPIDPSKRKLTELERLSWVVQQIDQDTALVPSGYAVLTPTRNMIENTFFKGLSVAQASDISSYLFWRNPRFESSAARARKAGVSNTPDFLDRISEDEPKGLWTLQTDSTKTKVSVRNLLWLGYEFSLTAHSSNKWGGVYIGTGERNTDLLFML